MAASELRLPPFFPASPAPCKAEADAFFTAFTAASAYAGDKERAGVGREALGALAPELQSYSACVRKHLSKKELARAPEHYTQQLPPK